MSLYQYLRVYEFSWPTFDEIEELAEEIALEPLNLDDYRLEPLEYA